MKLYRARVLDGYPPRITDYINDPETWQDWADSADDAATLASEYLGCDKERIEITES